MSRPWIVIYDVVAKQPVAVEVPGFWERRLWWPAARLLLAPRWVRHLLWVHAWPNRPGSKGTHAVARWLITHTPWWGGYGVSRPEIYRRWRRGRG